jgi:histidinol-phosphate aminotransferase
MTGPKPLSNILAITPYKGGQKLDHGWKLSSNENALGCSPVAIDAVSKAALSLELYPDGSAFALRQAIGAKYGIDPDCIVCGAGSDEIFQLLGRAYLQPGDEVLQSAHGFLVYSLVAQQSGAACISAPEKNLRADVDAMLERVTDRTKIVFLANPNNPTGSYIPHSEVKRLHAGLSDETLLVLDGAYAEYVDADDYDSGLDMARSEPNVLMTRTFSKIYGLAGLRLGWAYGPESIIDAVHRVRGPFNVTSAAQAAGIAALEDDAFVARSLAHNTAELERLKPALETMGFTVYPSVCNFLLIDFDSEQRADAADRFLRSRGIVIRDMKAYGLPTCMRLSIGTKEADDAVLEAFSAFAKAG